MLKVKERVRYVLVKKNKQKKVAKATWDLNLQMLGFSYPKQSGFKSLPTPTSMRILIQHP